jgi:hypothetical protein
MSFQFLASQDEIRPILGIIGAGVAKRNGSRKRIKSFSVSGHSSQQLLIRTPVAEKPRWPPGMTAPILPFVRRNTAGTGCDPLNPDRRHSDQFAPSKKLTSQVSNH